MNFKKPWGKHRQITFKYYTHWVTQYSSKLNLPDIRLNNPNTREVFLIQQSIWELLFPYSLFRIHFTNSNFRSNSKIGSFSRFLTTLNAVLDPLAIAQYTEMTSKDLKVQKLDGSSSSSKGSGKIGLTIFPVGCGWRWRRKWILANRILGDDDDFLQKFLQIPLSEVAKKNW